VPQASTGARTEELDAWPAPPDRRLDHLPEHAGHLEHAGIVTVVGADGIARTEAFQTFETPRSAAGFGCPCGKRFPDTDTRDDHRARCKVAGKGRDRLRDVIVRPSDGL
jgi:hypothetical protein